MPSLSGFCSMFCVKRKFNTFFNFFQPLVLFAAFFLNTRNFPNIFQWQIQSFLWLFITELTRYVSVYFLEANSKAGGNQANNNTIKALTRIPASEDQIKSRKIPLLFDTRCQFTLKENFFLIYNNFLMKNSKLKSLFSSTSLLLFLLLLLLFMFGYCYCWQYIHSPTFCTDKNLYS